MLGEWLKTKEVCPECSSDNTMMYSKTGDIYCGDCDMEYSK